MKKILYLSALFILLFSYAHAQNQFQKLVGTGFPGEAHSLCISQDGNYVAACAGSLFKVDTNSNVVWVKKYLSPLMYHRSYVIRQSNNGYLVIYDIISGGIGSDDIMVFNTDSAGQIEWIKVFGSSGFDIPADVKEMDNGDFVICGQSNGFDLADKDMLLIRISKVGEQLWQRTFGTASDDDHAEKLIASGSGDLIMAGSMAGKISLTKTNANGELTWSKVYGFGCLYDIVEDTTHGDLFVCGSMSPDNSKSGENLFVMKTDSAGNVEWVKLIGNNANETAYSISASSDHSRLYIAGRERPDSTVNGDAISLCLQATDGTIHWSRSYGTNENEVFYDNQLLNDNTLVNVGFSNYSDTIYHNLYIVKTSANGLSGCNETSFDPLFDSMLSIVAEELPIVLDSGDLTVITKCYPPSWTSYSCFALCSNSIANYEDTPPLRVYPNPVAAEATIELTEGGYLSYRIFDMAGKCVKDAAIEQQSARVTIKATDLFPGVYLIKLVRSNGLYASVKFVVE